MYRLSIPLMLNHRFERDFDLLMAQCQEAGADRLFFCAASCTSPKEEKERSLTLLRTYLPKAEELGFSCAVWIGSLGHGLALQHESAKEALPYPGVTLMQDLDGRDCGHSYCPLNPTFVSLFREWVKALASVGARMIMLDDDYRLSFRPGNRFCACSLHREQLAIELGEPVTGEMLKKTLAIKTPNRYRDAWLKVQGESLLHLARELREAIDEVDPTIRLGHCAVLSTWDLDGVDSLTLARAFAGQTKPFLRCIGAPYWSALRAFHDMRLAYVCEYERLQQAWCQDSDIEIFCEGDTYPRPRVSVPAAYLEGFDAAMRVAGSSDGILKYMLNYVSSPRMETGYLEAHRRHQPTYDLLHRHFDHKKAIGVSVFAPMNTLSLSHDPGEDYENRAIPAVLRFACDCVLPVRYDRGEEGTLLFGDAAELATAEQLNGGAILDLRAAEILTRRGFDVGLAAVGASLAPKIEYFPAYDEDVDLCGGDWYDITPSETAEILSYLSCEEGRTPASYYYENQAGHRFLVYAFRAQTSYEKDTFEHGIFRSRCRAEQLHELLPRLIGRQPLVSCRYGMNLYLQAKADDRSLSVALFNFSEDTLYEPAVTVAERMTDIAFAVGSGHLSDRTVTVDPIPPFGMAAFTLTR